MSAHEPPAFVDLGADYTWRLAHSWELGLTHREVRVLEAALAWYRQQVAIGAVVRLPVRP